MHAFSPRSRASLCFVRRFCPLFPLRKEKMHLSRRIIWTANISDQKLTFCYSSNIIMEHATNQDDGSPFESKDVGKLSFIQFYYWFGHHL